MLASAAMTPFQAAILGAVQGLTEFLPISSSAHLYLVPTVLGWPYGGLGFDVALHWGTLAALLFAFWRDWYELVRDVFAPDPARSSQARSTWLKLALASIPAAVVGVLLKDVAETRLRSVTLQAVMLFVFGFLLWWVDRSRPAGSASLDPADRTRAPGWGTCLAMGFAQSIALVPGVSRSGVTMTAGRAAGLDRVSAARFSFLLATPITFGAGLVELRHVDSQIAPATLAIGIVSSALVGLFAIRGLLRWLGRAGFGAFFVYRALVAALLLIWAGRQP